MGKRHTGKDRRPAADYDWAQAVLQVAQTPEASLAAMAKAAGLDPLAGDLSHLDLSDTSIAGQDLRGWDLQHARLHRSRIAGADLRHAQLSAAQLIEAVGWHEAQLDPGLRHAASLLHARRFMNMTFADYLRQIEGRDVEATLAALSAAASAIIIDGRRYYGSANQYDVVQIKNILIQVALATYFIGRLAKDPQRKIKNRIMMRDVFGRLHRDLTICESANDVDVAKWRTVALATLWRVESILMRPKMKNRFIAR